MDSQEDSREIANKAKEAFLHETFQIQKELGKCQREYKKVISLRLKKRSELIVEKSYVKTIRSLEKERNILRAQFWVANGKAHMFENERYLKLIKCHIKCQEHLADDINKLKVHISNLEYEISHTDREIYELNRKTVPDTQHQDYVRRTRAKMSILENRLEVGIRRESGFTAANAVLREELSTLLDYREFFNNCFLRLVQKLNTDKKYMNELLKYAYNTFEDCINLHERNENNLKKRDKENDNLKADMQMLIRNAVASDGIYDFVQIKNQLRELAPIHSKEEARREKFRHTHVRKINLYNNILNKLLSYTNAANVEEVIGTYQNQQSTYYSYYTLAIEIDYHLTLLENAVNQLNNDLQTLKTDNGLKSYYRANKIAELEKIYQAKKMKNSELRIAFDTKKHLLEKLFQDITSIFNISRCYTLPLMLLLGDNTKVNLSNLRKFLKVLETRISDILAAVYLRERTDSTKMPENYVVKGVSKYIDEPTPLDDIVLTQQCPECAEGEAYNMDDVAGDSINVHSIEEAKKKLSEKVNQPEMQYRLHRISQCRLPRSHFLVAKRHL